MRDKMALERFDEGTKDAILKFLFHHTTFGGGKHKDALTALMHEVTPLLSAYGIAAQYKPGDEEWHFQYENVKVRLLFWEGRFRVFLTTPEVQNHEITDMPVLYFDATTGQFVGWVVGRDLTRLGAPPVRASAHEALVTYVLGVLAL